MAVSTRPVYALTVGLQDTYNEINRAYAAAKPHRFECCDCTCDKWFTTRALRVAHHKECHNGRPFRCMDTLADGTPCGRCFSLA
ncbi:hypothetical protein KIPB_012240, partial [Kipferlia bialata]|eukprot:g12240.t1